MYPSVVFENPIVNFQDSFLLREPPIAYRNCVRDSQDCLTRFCFLVKTRGSQHFGSGKAQPQRGDVCVEKIKLEGYLGYSFLTQSINANS